MTLCKDSRRIYDGVSFTYFKPLNPKLEALIHGSGRLSDSESAKYSINAAGFATSEPCLFGLDIGFLIGIGFWGILH